MHHILFISPPPPPRDLPPKCALSDLGPRSSRAVMGYINNLLANSYSTDSPQIDPSLTLQSLPQTRSAMSIITASQTAEERLAHILSNQYYHCMKRNRARWYQANPVDTAPKPFAPWQRTDISYIKNWKAYYKVIAQQAANGARAFSHRNYDINGVVWNWRDPASDLLIDLFTPDAIDTVEFAISSDPFCAPHIVVTHSPGHETQYLNTHANPDQLTNAPSEVVPNPWGCTPRQQFVGPTGKDQLLLPPRMSIYYEREDYAQQCAAAIANRRNIMLRLSIQFHEGLRKIKARRRLIVGYTLEEEIPARGRQIDLKDISTSHPVTLNTISEEADFEPTSQEDTKTDGFSDFDAAESLFVRCGIMLQPRLDDINLLADSAILSDDSGDESDESLPSIPHGSTIANETFEVLRRLGMVHGYTINMEDEDEEDADYGDEEDEDEDEDEDDESESESEDEDEDEDTTGHFTIPDAKASVLDLISGGGPASSSWGTEHAALPISAGSLDFASMLHKDADEEQSSVSSLFVSEDQDSISSDCETPDTEDEC